MKIILKKVSNNNNNNNNNKFNNNNLFQMKSHLKMVLEKSVNLLNKVV